MPRSDEAREDRGVVNTHAHRVVPSGMTHATGMLLTPDETLRVDAAIVSWTASQRYCIACGMNEKQAHSYVADNLPASEFCNARGTIEGRPAIDVFADLLALMREEP